MNVMYGSRHQLLAAQYLHSAAAHLKCNIAKQVGNMDL